MSKKRKADTPREVGVFPNEYRAHKAFISHIILLVVEWYAAWRWVFKPYVYLPLTEGTDAYPEARITWGLICSFIMAVGYFTYPITIVISVEDRETGFFRKADPLLRKVYYIVCEVIIATGIQKLLSLPEADKPWLLRFVPDLFEADEWIAEHFSAPKVLAIIIAVAGVLQLLFIRLLVKNELEPEIIHNDQNETMQIYYGTLKKKPTKGQLAIFRKLDTSGGVNLYMDRNPTPLNGNEPSTDNHELTIEEINALIKKEERIESKLRERLKEDNYAQQ